VLSGQEAYSEGKSGQSISLDGDTQIDGVKLDDFSQFSVVMFFKPVNDENINTPLFDSPGQFVISLYGSNAVKFALRGESTGSGWHMSGLTLLKDEWNMIVLTHDGTDTKLYVNDNPIFNRSFR